MASVNCCPSMSRTRCTCQPAEAAEGVLREQGLGRVCGSLKGCCSAQAHSCELREDLPGGAGQCEQERQ